MEIRKEKRVELKKPDKERIRTMELLEQEKKSYWDSKLDINSYNKGFTDGIKRAIKILETEQNEKN